MSKFKCAGKTKKGKKCRRLMKTEGALCYQHKVKERDPAITGLIDENGNFDVDKFFRLTEMKQECCRICKKPEEWRTKQNSRYEM